MKSLIVMGAGNIGKMVCEYVLPEMIEEYEEIYFFDSDEKKQGTYIDNYYILSIENLREKISRGNIGLSFVLATDYWRELYSICKEYGVDENIIAVYTGKSTVTGKYRRIGYGQDGEDFYLQEQFGMRKKGFYVDIGAHHPFRFSNTYWAYRHGWNGINIEPNERVMPLFNKARARDINLNCGIAEEEGVINYFKFSEGAYNTFDKAEFEGKRIPDEIVKVPVYRLETILEKHQVEHISFMNIDVEGLELSVLKSNNWDKWKPEYILIEQKNMTIDEIVKSDVYDFLMWHGYKCDWKSIRTVAYKLQ